MLYQESFLVVLHRSQNFRAFVNSLKVLITDFHSQKEMFLENSCTFYGTQIILANIALLRRS